MVHFGQGEAVGFDVRFLLLIQCLELGGAQRLGFGARHRLRQVQSRAQLRRELELQIVKKVFQWEFDAEWLDLDMRVVDVAPYGLEVRGVGWGSDVPGEDGPYERQVPPEAESPGRIDLQANGVLEALVAPCALRDVIGGETCQSLV